MARLSLDLLIFLHLIFGSLFPTIFAARPEQDTRPEDPPEVPSDDLPGTNVQANPAGRPPGREPPFSGSESGEETEDGEEIDLSDLFDKLKDLLDDIASLYQPNSTTSSMPAIATAAPQTTAESNSNAAPTSVTALSTGQPNATLGCEIYQSYTALCPNMTIAPYVVTIGPLTVTVDASEALTLAESARASCLCYSSVYYVPEAYDDAAWACAGYTTATSMNSDLAAAATIAAETYGFCSSIGNVRIDAVTATFGQFTATPAPSASPSASTSAGPTSMTGSSSKSTGAARRLVEVKRGVGTAAAAMVIVVVVVMV